MATSFDVDANDIASILKQIKIAEATSPGSNAASRTLLQAIMDAYGVAAVNAAQLQADLRTADGTDDDTIVWDAGDGRAIVDGGLGGTDTFVINGADSTTGPETFKVYARAAAEAVGISSLAANTDVVITRSTGTNAQSVVAELDEIEQIVINTGGGDDTVTAIGNFNPTDLAFRAIRIHDDGGSVTVDVAGLESEHHVALYSTGDDDRIDGRRAQDEIITGSLIIGTGDDPADDGVTTPTGPHIIECFIGQPVADGDVSTPAIPPLASQYPISGSGEMLIATTGNDVVQGGAANALIFADSGDDLIFTGNGGVNVVAGDGADVVNGGSGADAVFGGAGGDTILGEAGIDSLWGEDGNDLIEGGEGADRIWGGKGADDLDGGNGNDRIWGGDGNDAVHGGAGTDRIEGGDGADLLWGDGDDDIFVFRTAAAADGDTIADFQVGDRIDLSMIDPGNGGSSFSIVAGTTFTGAGQLIVHSENGQTFIEGNIDGDSAADFQVTIAGLHDLKHGIVH